jgi:hypothetical protein
LRNLPHKISLLKSFCADDLHFSEQAITH